MGFLPLLGIVYHVMRLQKIMPMQASQYPHLPADQFERWKRLELTSIYLFLGALTLLTVCLQGARLVMPPEGSHSSSHSDMIIPTVMLFFVGLGVFFVLLIISAVMGSMASSLRKSLNITVSVLNSKEKEAEVYSQQIPPFTPASYSPPTAPRPQIYINSSSAPGINKGGLACLIAAVIGLPLLAYWVHGYTQTLSENSSARGPLTTAPVAGSPHSSDGREKRVMALYYPWYQTPQISHKWAHQTGVNTAHKRMTSHTHYPVQGPYDSSDPAAIDRHLHQAEQAGIDTLVCSWWGPKDATDSALRVLFARAAKTKIMICVLWEQPAQPANRQTLDKQFGYLLTAFGKQPAYLKVKGKPVVFLFDRVCRSVAAYRWPTIRSDVESRYALGALVIGDGTGTEHLKTWDGQFTLGAASFLEGGQGPGVCARLQHDGYEAVLRKAREVQSISVVTVAPGYDDRKPNAALGQPANTVMDRQNGQLYSALWRQAIADNPDWILINSFNQWHAGTEIEPSAELGDTYLNLTHQYAAQFKGNAAR